MGVWIFSDDLTYLQLFLSITFANSFDKFKYISLMIAVFVPPNQNSQFCTVTGKSVSLCVFFFSPIARKDHNEPSLLF